MLMLKQELHKQCKEILNQQLEVIQIKIADIQKALQSETKSSAGDKHETGRAMLQLEREKVGQQLVEIQKQFTILSRVLLESQQNTVALGSIVFTSQLNYFISTSLGELRYGGNTFYAISIASPIAKLLIGKVIGDTFSFRNQEITITKII